MTGRLITIFYGFIKITGMFRAARKKTSREEDFQEHILERILC